MSENRDETTGQFAPAEPPTGREALEREAGYIPYDDGSKTAEPEGSVKELAEQLTERREELSAPESTIKTYSVLDDLPENTSFTPEQMGKILADARAAEADAAEAAEIEQTRKEVDALRGETPEAAKTTEAATDKPAEPAQPGEIDPEVAKALENPKIKAALDQHIGAAENTRQQYLASIEAATQIAQAAFISQFPEFAGIPEEQRGQALATMQQQDPERFGRIAAAVQNSAQLFEAQKAAQEWQQQQKQAAFQNYAKAEDARFETMIKGETPETMRAVEKEIIAAIGEYGGDAAQFFEQFKSSDFLRNATVQRMMVDAAKYRIVSKAKVAVATRQVPPVLRPGASQPTPSHEARDWASASKQFDRNPSVKNAAALIAAARKGAQR
ncbi:hypothetical protein ABH973_006239 [Bradyrhizobium ottawaense]|uniref:hypothetical protein n=1 Tax=Bradyrhizobium ottawaense TaxID=931866 RepID=UPI0035148338